MAKEKVKPRLLVYSARGAASFSHSHVSALKAVSDVRFALAKKPVPSDDFLKTISGYDYLGLTPRSNPDLSVLQMRGLRHLKGISIPTTGYEWLNVKALSKFGIPVSNLPDFSSSSCSEFTIGLLLSMIRKIPLANEQAKSHGRSQSSLMGVELKGKSLGVIGYGAIGKTISKMARGLGLNVLAWDRDALKIPGRVRSSLNTVLEKSDFLSLHLQLNRDTKNFIGRKTLAKVKPGVFLVNSARPDLVDVPALLESLSSGRVAGYAFDSGYWPAERAKKSAGHPGILAVPHISWYTREAVARELDGWVDNMVLMCKGKMANRIQAG
jgi:D-3-phosphoglycerate dehydrogenase / 2-oxoglutarate reductase